MARARRRLEGGARPRRADGEVLRVGKDGYRLFQNDEGESESTSLAVPLERSFCVSFLIFPDDSWPILSPLVVPHPLFLRRRLGVA